MKQFKLVAMSICSVLLLLAFSTGPVYAQFEFKLTASDAAKFDGFGNFVALDGNLALIGSAGDDDNGLQSGSAYIFRFDGTTWVEEAKLTASDGEEVDQFGGFGVALDGDVALIGARGDDDKGSGSGSAYIFRFDGTTWVEEAKLTASDGAPSDLFGGHGVALDGNVAVIGSPRHDNTGSVYVFRYNGTTWDEVKLTASDGEPGDGFGGSVALDGNVALITAKGDDDKAFNAGSVYVFRFDGTIWVEEAKLTASDGMEGHGWGDHVALDGNVALIGVLGDDDACPPTIPNCDAGAAYVFRYNGTSWVEESKFTPRDATSHYTQHGIPNKPRFGFGRFVALSGNVALVAAPTSDDACPKNPSDPNPFCHSGSAYVFRFDGTNWVEQAKLTASDAEAFDLFGDPIALSGNLALVGQTFGDDACPEDPLCRSGSAYIYDLTPISIIDNVQELVNTSVLSQGRGNGLIASLESVINHLNNGNTTAAINGLQLFINKVNVLINTGELLQEDGQPLIDAANDFAILLNALSKQAIDQQPTTTIQPNEYALNQNYPNPFNPTTTIHYELPFEGFVTLKVFDVLGKEVKTLIEGYRTEGRYEVEFDATNLTSGMYFYRIQTGSFVETKKMILMK